MVGSIWIGIYIYDLIAEIAEVNISKIAVYICSVDVTWFDPLRIIHLSLKLYYVTLTWHVVLASHVILCVVSLRNWWKYTIAGGCWT